LGGDPGAAVLRRGVRRALAGDRRPARPARPAAAVSGTSGRRPLRVGVDATPLLGVRTRGGRYVEHLVAALARPRPAPEAPLRRAPTELDGSATAERAGQDGAGRDGPVTTGLRRAPATPGHVQPAGPAVPDRPELAELRATAFTWRGQEELPAALPPG